MADLDRQTRALVQQLDQLPVDRIDRVAQRLQTVIHVDQPRVRWNSRMNCASACTPAIGIAL